MADIFLKKTQLLSGYLNEYVKVERWIIYLFIILIIIFIYKYIKNLILIFYVKKNKNDDVVVEELATTSEDIIARLCRWWPVSGDDYSSPVNVNFKSLEKELSLQQGSVKKHIKDVANKKSFKTVAIGETDAHFEYEPRGDAGNMNDDGCY